MLSPLPFASSLGPPQKSRKRVIAALSAVAFLLSMGLSALELSTSYQDSPPKYYRSGNDGIGGLCFEILRLIERELPPELDIRFSVRNEVFVPFPRILKWLERGEIDIFVGLARNEEREARFVFLDTPLYDVHHVVAARGDDDVIVLSLEDLRRLGDERPILSSTGSSTTSFLQKQAGIQVDDGARTIEQNLEKLLAGRGRLVYFHDLGLRFAIRESFADSDLKILPTSFHSYRHYLAFSPKVSPDVVQEVERVLQKLAENGALQELRDRY